MSKHVKSTHDRLDFPCPNCDYVGHLKHHLSRHGVRKHPGQNMFPSTVGHPETPPKLKRKREVILNEAIADISGHIFIEEGEDNEKETFDVLDPNWVKAKEKILKGTFYFNFLTI